MFLTQNAFACKVSLKSDHRSWEQNGFYYFIDP